MLSAIEKQRKAKADREQESDFAAQDMSGELQTIPARHGVATFVPRGRTIKIINTYGQQVVSTWAFGLGAPPEEGEDEEEEEEMEAQVDDLKKELSKEDANEEEGKDKPSKEDDKEQATEGKGSKDKATEEDATKVSGEAPEATKEEGPPEEEQSDNVATKDGEGAEDPPEQAPETSGEEQSKGKKAEKRTWASYLPSIPYRSKGQGQGQGQGQSKPDAQAQQEEKAQNEETSKRWSSYLPTGKGFSSYVPNVKMPDTQGVVSAFKSSNSWDPNKSYAEQLYDFSKTPVGAGTLAGMFEVLCFQST